MTFTGRSENLYLILHVAGSEGTHSLNQFPGQQGQVGRHWPETQDSQVSQPVPASAAGWLQASCFSCPVLSYFICQVGGLDQVKFIPILTSWSPLGNHGPHLVQVSLMSGQVTLVSRISKEVVFSLRRQDHTQQAKSTTSRGRLKGRVPSTNADGRRDQPLGRALSGEQPRSRVS